MIEKNTFRRFFILQWKNFLLKRRHWVLTLCEVVIPTLLFVILVVIRNTGGEDVLDSEAEMADRPKYFKQYKLSITPKPKPAVVKRAEPYPMQYCESLLDHMTNGTLSDRLLGFTNRPGSKTRADIPDSQLVMDTMRIVSGAIEDFIWPFCNVTATLISNIDALNVTLPWVNSTREQGTLVIRYFENEAEIEAENNKYQSNREAYEFGEMLGGVIFSEDVEYENQFALGINENKNASVPPLKYTLRLSPEFVNTNTDVLFPIFQLSGPGYDGEAYSDFVKFQNLIDLAYIQIATGEKMFPDNLEDRASIKWMPASEQMPYPPYLENNLAAILGFMLPLFTVLSFCFIVPPLMKRIVFEKQSGVKELMKLMGLANWTHWLSWFLNAYVTSAISVLIMTVLICVEWKDGTGAVLVFSNPVLIYIFLMLYASALIMSLFAISAFFDSPNLALALGVLVHIISYLIPSVYITDDVYVEMSGALKATLAVVPNIALWWGIKVISIEEGRGAGIQWDTLGDRAEPSDPMTMSLVFVMLIADVLIYAVIVWYIDGIWPGKYGVRRKWYFPFQLSYWIPQCKEDKKQEDLKEGGYDDARRGDHFEMEPEGSLAGVRVKGLRKVFSTFRGSSTVAVDDVTFSAYRGQITALLGHNGAGKTTTMSVLTGMYSPSGGEAFINGHDIGTEMEKARKSLGLCPQHNMLFSELTVREHLIFFAMLKGLSRKESINEADTYVRLLSLDAKTNFEVTKLSGGMKRKVNLGIALIGGSEVVMLDEPTSGMDPEARRGMWDLLQVEKRGRTILLTTHFMEEADVLGDRIAIMSKGRVQCYGSPLYLKRQFGKGYTLSMSRGGSCDAYAALDVVRQVVPGAQLKSDAAGEIVVNLPDAQLHKFAQLFETLEREKSRLDVLNFGLSITTMEDVFLKVGSMAEKASNLSVDRENGHRRELSLTSYQSQMSNSPAKTLVTERLEGTQLWITKLWALLSKRLVYASRRWIFFTVMGLVPLVIALICQLVVNDANNTVKSYDPITFGPNNTINHYTDVYTYVNAESCGKCKDLAGDFHTVAAPISRMVLPLTDANLTEYILDAADKYGEARYREDLVVAADFQQRRHCLAGRDLCASDYVELIGVWNSVPTHSRPLVQNMISNTLLSTLRGGHRENELFITTTNHPLDKSKNWEMDILTDGVFISGYPFAYGVALSIGLGILVAAFIVFPLAERITSAKQVQMMTGLDPATFWLSNVICDYSLYFVSIALAVGLLVLMDEMKYFSTNGCTGTMLLILFLYGLCGIPMAYSFSYVCKSPASGFALLIVLNILAGAIAPTAAWLLRIFGDYNSDDYDGGLECEFGLGGCDVEDGDEGGNSGLVIASEIIRYLCILMPAFPLSRSIMAIIQVQEENLVCENGMSLDSLEAMCGLYQSKPEALLIEESRQYAQCCSEEFVDPEYAFCGQELDFMGNPIKPVECHTETSFYTWDGLTGINTDLIFFFVNIVFYCSLVVALELGYINRLKTHYMEWRRNKLVKKGKMSNDDILTDMALLDDDVREEQRRIKEVYNSMDRRGADALVVTDLSKRFHSMTAVRGLSFGVHHGECFGLLGINGAGKTTTFRMLTGDETPTTGEASMLGYSLNGDRRDFLRQVGYCPQFDSIIEVLTGREMLRLFGRLRGLPKEVVEEEIEHWLRVFGIEEYADRQCGSYSGGNKRKLNVAMALMGDPPVVFLDEPSTGVDPVARRRLWNIIGSIQHNGQSVVLTSHSMEECEALCDRLSIMVNGQFQCLGGCQHLKNKFGQGFTILLKLNTRGLAPQESAAAMQEVKDVVMNRFNECSIKDEHKDYVHFHVGDVTTPWHRLFETMEGIKNEFPSAEDYSVSETTLEQVFLSFAKHQKMQDADESDALIVDKKSSMRSKADSFVSVILDSEGPEV